MFYKRNILNLYPLNELISNVMHATGPKISTGATKGTEKQEILKIFSWENI